MNTIVLDTPTLQFGRLLHYAGLAVALISAAAAHTILYTPIERDILNAEIRLDELAQSRQNADVIQQEHQRLSTRLREISERYEALQRRVPESAEAGSFLKDVSMIARSENLVVNNFQPQNAVEHNGYTTLEVNLSGTGSFASICSFFARLSEINRLVKVKDLIISAEEHLDTYPMQATLIIYFGLRGERDVAAGEEVSRG